VNGPRLVRSPIGSPARRRSTPCEDALTPEEVAPLGVTLNAALVCANPRRHVELADEHPGDRSFWHRSLDPPAIWSLDHQVASIADRTGEEAPVT